MPNVEMHHCLCGEPIQVGWPWCEGCEIHAELQREQEEHEIRRQLEEQEMDEHFRNHPHG